MTKNAVMLKISLVPVLILLALIGGAGYLLLSEDIKIPWLRKDNTVEVRRLEGFPYVVPGGNLEGKKRAVIKSQEELETFLKDVDNAGNLALEEKIDFGREYLIGVASETRLMGGYELKVKKVYVDKEDDSLLVLVRELKPGESCLVTEATNTPVDIVAINKTDKTIEFDAIKEVNECSDESESTDESNE